MMIQALDSGHSGPLCPMAGTETSYGAVHRAHVAVHDAAYDAAPKDADGELASQVAEEMLDSIDRRYPAYMNLFEHVVSLPRGAVYRSAWFQCRTCGFVLPTARQ